MMEHIENAGIHSGDSACVIPPHTLSLGMIQQIKKYTRDIAQGLHVVGLLNIQYAIKGDRLYVLEVNPRASRTVPFVSKATGVPLAKIAAQVMAGKRIKDFHFVDPMSLEHIAVKESVLPFSRFSGVDIVLGPEMKSTGEVMGIDLTFGAAFAKSQMCALQALPHQGRVFLSVNDEDKRQIAFLAKKLTDMGFTVMSTQGTARALKAAGVKVEVVSKVGEGDNDLLGLIKQNKIDLIINTPSGERSQSDMRVIRSVATLQGTPCITTIQAAWAAVGGIETTKERGFEVFSLQDYYARQEKKCVAL
jgi:carbamoyl-phosphate synthase large subunit